MRLNREQALIPSLTIPVYIAGLTTGGMIQGGAGLWLILPAIITAVVAAMVCSCLWLLLRY